MQCRWSIRHGTDRSKTLGHRGRLYSFRKRVFRSHSISHETACILNAGSRDAHVEITLYFANRKPVGPYQVTVAAGCTLHLRFNDLKDPAQVPRDTDYSSVFESDVPIVVQHTRMDTRRAEISLLSTIAFAGGRESTANRAPLPYRRARSCRLAAASHKRVSPRLAGTNRH